MAEHSYIWTYKSDDLSVQFSIDRPWAEWHNLHICYRGRGWESRPDYFKLTDGDNLSYSELSLEQAGRYGKVLFTAVDRNGREIAPGWRQSMWKISSFPAAILRQVARSLGIGVEDQFALSGNRLPVSTLQLCSEGSKYTAEQEDELRRFFFEARKIYLNQFQDG